MSVKKQIRGRARTREGEGSVDDAKAFGKRLCEVQIWRGLNLREAAGLAGRSFSFWGQVERGEKDVTNPRRWRQYRL